MNVQRTLLDKSVMSDETYVIITAAISTLAAVAGLWSAIRRRQIMRRLLRSLSEQQLKDAGLLPREDETKRDRE